MFDAAKAPRAAPIAESSGRTRAKKALSRSGGSSASIPPAPRPAEVKTAAALLERARGTYVAFAAADEVGALAKGAACLGAGTAGEADAVACAGGDNAPNVRFAYPREGAPLEIYAFAIPRDAPIARRAPTG